MEIITAVKYCLLVGKDITIGRKDTDIVLCNDPTVSRKHAVIQVTHTEANLPSPSRPATVLLKDESRFGTWVNGTQLPTKGHSTLNDGDQIKFGSPKSTFMCVHEPLVVSTSCLDTGQKKAVRRLVCKLGGHVVKDWQRDCSMLVMTRLSVTVKVVSAMVSLKPIVTMDYLTSLEQALEQNTELPEPEQFTPELSDPHLSADNVSFNPDPARQHLFRGKTFLFLNNTQFTKLSLTVEMAGGTPVLQEAASKDESGLVGEDCVVMFSSPEDPGLTDKVKKWVTRVQALLKRHKKRMIPDSEIGYAVVFCSTERHCNPDLQPVEDLGIALPSQSLSERPYTQEPDVIVPNTMNTEPSQSIPTRQPKHGKKHACSQSQSSAPVAPEVQVKSEENRVVVKTEVRSQESQPRGASRVEQTGDFSVDLHSAGDVLTPAFTPRKRGRDTETEGDSIRNPKSARKYSSPLSSVKVKKESPEQRERTLPEAKSRRRGGREICPTEESSSDDQGTFVRPTNRDKVLVQDTEVDHVSVRREKQLSDNEGPTRISDSDPESKPVKMLGGRGKSDHSSSDDMDQSHSKTSPARPRDITAGRVKSEPAAISVRTELGDSETELFEEEVNDDAVSAPARKLRKTSPSHKTSSYVDHEEDTFHTSKKKSSPGPRSDKSPSPTRKPPPRSRPKSTPSVAEVEEGTDVNSNRVYAPQGEGEGAEGRPALRDEDVPAGFLTTRLPIEDQIRAVDDFVKEEVTAQICVEFKTLMVRRPRGNVPVSRNVTDEDGFIMWKGKRVKNFKKFRKSEHLGSGTLPQIIGGSDLEPHVNNPRQELDQWYSDALQAESHQNEADRLASQLFDWESKPIKGKAAGKRSR